MKIRITKKGLPKAQMWNSQIGKPQSFNMDWSKFMPQTPQITIPYKPGYTPPPPPDVTIPRNLFPDPFSTMSEDEMTPPEVLAERQQSSAAPNTRLSDIGIGPNYMMSDLDKEIQQKYDSDPNYALKYDDSVGFGMLQNYYDGKGTSRKDMKKYVNFFNKKYGTDLKLPAYNPGIAKAANAVNTGIGALTTLSTVVDYFGANKKKKEWERYFRQKMAEEAPSTEFEGIENINTGRMFENMLPKPNQGRAEYGGENTQQSMRIRITAAPDAEMMEYGGQSRYGLDLGRKKIYTDMPETKSEKVGNTLYGVPREQANIEAEGGETVYGDLDGDGGMEHMKVSGPRHTEGGVPLNVPEGSFVFSDTAKMRIKNPEVLKYFGLPAKKGGYTPAEIAKRYDINKYKAIMEDETTDELNKNTAQLMIKNYEKKLSQLAMIQEEMKGFPQGVPQVAQQEMEGEEQLLEAEYGGSLPKFQGDKKGSTVKKATDRVSVWDEDEQKALQEYIKKKYNVEIPINARDANAQRFTLPLTQPSRDSRRVYGDEDWTAKENMADFARRQRKFIAENPGWDPTKVGATEKFQRWYDEQRAKKGMKPYFGKGQTFQAYDDKFGEYTFSAPDIEPTEPTVEKVPDSPIGYICTGLDANGVPVIQESSYKDEAALAAAGAFKTRAQAEMSCPKPPPGKIPTPPPGKTAPPGFLTPDKLTIAAAAAIPPQAYLPFYSDVQFRPGQLALEDWLSQAQNIQQTYNTAANTLGQYQPGTALASNLSFLAGQAGDQASQAISQVGNRNVDRFNQFSGVETQRKQAVDAYNAAARDKRWEGYTVAKQNLDNSRRKYLNTVTKAVNNAWANRMYLDLINKVNPIYNIDPTSGLSYFKQGWNFDRLSNNPMGASSGNWSNLAGLKAKYMRFGMSEANAEKKAMADIEGPKANYTDSDMDGVPNSMRMTGNAQMAALQQMLPFALGSLKFGPTGYGDE